MSELTNKRLEEYVKGELTVLPLDGKEMAHELLTLRSLRDAGDEEVDKLFVNAMHGIGVDESVNPEGCRSSQRSLEELHCAAITRGQQLREAREEIERWEKRAEWIGSCYKDDANGKSLVIFDGTKSATYPDDAQTIAKLIDNAMTEGCDVSAGLLTTKQQIQSLQSQIATLTAERDEALSKLTALEVAVRNLTDTIAEMETRKEADKSNAAMSDRCNRVLRVLRDSGNADAESAFWIIAGDARESRAHNLRITAELAALKSAPGMEEVDFIAKPYCGQSMQSACKNHDKLADIARRSIASRDEAVELLKWLDEFWDFKEVKKCLCEYASDKVYGDNQQKARRIIEIVEGK